MAIETCFAVVEAELIAVLVQVARLTRALGCPVLVFTVHALNLGRIAIFREMTWGGWVRRAVGSRCCTRWEWVAGAEVAALALGPGL